MKKLFLGLSLTAVLASCGTTTPAPHQSNASGNRDVQAIQQQLQFDSNHLLALKESAETALTPEQLEIAKLNIEVSNYMVENELMEFGAQPDGSLYLDADLSTQQLEAQGICDNKISYVTWINRDGMISASNHPTSCGTWVGNHFNSLEAWYESARETPNHSSWNRGNSNQNASMYNQFQCHYLVVRGAKTPWNLEPHRPNVGYASTVAAGCNPN